MLKIIPTPQFSAWQETITDDALLAIIASRLGRLRRGLAGDVAPVGEGVSELRIHVGAGHRIYFVQRGNAVVVLLGGGTKRTQKKDIKSAKALAATLNFGEL